MPSRNPVYSDDPYLGCISAELVAPPHNAKNLKNCLTGVEALDPAMSISLFVNASSRAPMARDGRVSILAYPGPGCTPNEPMALLARVSIKNIRRLSTDVAAPETVIRELTPLETRYSKRSRTG